MYHLSDTLGLWLGWDWGLEGLVDAIFFSPLLFIDWSGSVFLLLEFFESIIRIRIWRVCLDINNRNGYDRFQKKSLWIKYSLILNFRLKKYNFDLSKTTAERANYFLQLAPRLSCEFYWQFWSKKISNSMQLKLCRISDI